MRGAHDHVLHSRMRGGDGRERIDRQLVPLVRTHEPEAQDHLAPIEPEPRLDRHRIGERQVRHAMRDDLDPAGWDAVGAGQQLRRRL